MNDVPNDGQKKAMGDILRAMNAAITNPATGGFAPDGRAPMHESNAVAPPALGTDDAKVDAMKNIMAAFKSATNNVRDNAHGDHILMEALQTERTDSGVRISEWEIVISEQEGRPGKFYDVIRDDINIASDLRLYEAALLLTQELNKGESITSPKVRESSASKKNSRRTSKTPLTTPESSRRRRATRR
jgi:hypothetical protein